MNHRVNLARSVRGRLTTPPPVDLRPQTWLDAWDEGLLATAFGAWARICPRPLVLFLDEIDAHSGRTLLSLLGQVRDGYRRRPAGFPASIALCGLRVRPLGQGPRQLRLKPRWLR